MPTERLQYLLYQIDPDHGTPMLVNVEDLPGLHEYVKGRDPLLAERAAGLAAQVDGDASLPVLEDALASHFEQTRIAATRGLDRLTELPEEAFSAALSDDSPAVKRFALRALGSRRTKRPQEALPERLLEQLSHLREGASDAASQRAADLLLQRFGHGVTREVVARGLAQGLSATDVGTLVGPDGTDAVVAIVEGAEDANAAKAAVEVASVIGDDAAKRAAEMAINSGNAGVRRSAARLLQKHSDIPGAEHLVGRLLNDSEPAVRREAAVAAAKRPTQVLRSKLEEVMSQDPDSSVRDLVRELLRHSNSS